MGNRANINKSVLSEKKNVKIGFHKPKNKIISIFYWPLLIFNIKYRPNSPFLKELLGELFLRAESLVLWWSEC